MSMYFRTGLLALSLVASSAVFAPTEAHAGKERCKVYVDGDYKLVGKTFTDGGCASKAREMVGPAKCAGGSKKFEYKYMFDGHITEKESYCSNLR